MIWEEGQEIVALWKDGKRITAIWETGQLIWEAIKSCYGSGVWRDDKPWRDDDVWRD